MLANIGFGELAIILVIGGAVVLLFGVTRIPKVARALGQGFKELKKGVREAKAEDEDAEKPPAKKPAAPKARAKKPAAKKR